MLRCAKLFINLILFGIILHEFETASVPQKNEEVQRICGYNVSRKNQIN